MRLLLIDNYDSFTYNLVQRIGELDATVSMHVVRNDQITADEAIELDPSHLIISPGPCTPSETGVSGELISLFKGKIPILGVCLGHQAIADLHGMEVIRHDRLMHGKTSEIHHDGEGLFRDLPNPMIATRYHSLIVSPGKIDPAFKVSAWTDEQEIMGLRWIDEAATAAPMDGVQFHPESFLTTDGPKLLANFLNVTSAV